MHQYTMYWSSSVEAASSDGSVDPMLGEQTLLQQDLSCPNIRKMQLYERYQCVNCFSLFNTLNSH